MANILVVEDDVTTNNLVSDYLADAGHTVFSAYDGLEALRYFQRESIELMILDIMLPNVDGIRVLKEIRKTSSVPILMLTALSDEGTQIASFDCLADDYITKPFSIVLLGKRVLALLRRAGKLEEKDIWRHRPAANASKLGICGLPDTVAVFERATGFYRNATPGI